MSTRLQTCLETVALDYLDRGFSVIPLPYRQKRASIKWKLYQSERASETQVRKWFTKTSNIAIVTGEVSKLVVRDFDDKAKYRQWKDNHPGLAAQSPTVATASGFHVYVTMDPIPRLRVSGVGCGELRGSGGYVVAPPSIHPSGIEYSWTVPLCDPLPIVSFADLDLEHLSTNFTEEDGRGQKRTDNRSHREERERENDDSLVQKFQDEIALSIPSEVGQRERKLFELARRLKRHKLETDELLVIFDHWWKLSKDIVGTKNYEVSMNAFLRSVEHATTPLDDVVGDCLARAKANPKPAWSMRFNAECQLLAGLCRELQIVNGSDPFFLSCRTAGEQIELSHTVANQYLQLFERLKKLVVVRRGSVGGSRATRYRYVDAYRT